MPLLLAHSDHKYLPVETCTRPPVVRQLITIVLILPTSCGSRSQPLPFETIHCVPIPVYAFKSASAKPRARGS